MVKRARSRSRSRFTKRKRTSSKRKFTKRPRRKTSGLARKVNAMYKMIETKEGCIASPVNFALAHNDITVVQNSAGAVFNPLFSQQGVQDPNGPNDARRIGDRITIKGIMLKAFFENALSRPKVWYRLMVIKMAKGDTYTRATLFKGDSTNKMLDLINTERYTIVAQKTFTINCTNTAPTGVNLSGIPTGETGGGPGTKIVKMWLPGYKFGKGGTIVYEDGSSQPKFYDYRIIIVAYDWFGTPQDINSVGKVNELFTKIYFKDA